MALHVTVSFNTIHKPTGQKQQIMHPSGKAVALLEGLSELLIAACAFAIAPDVNKLQSAAGQSWPGRCHDSLPSALGPTRLQRFPWGQP